MKQLIVTLFRPRGARTASAATSARDVVTRDELTRLFAAELTR